MLKDLPRRADEDLLVGYQTDDDAAVYRVKGGQLLLQTVDFFPPMVDDPYTFGQIAAANALSDIYAMGGTPRLALNLFAFPSNKLPPAYAREILRGGADKVLEAGAFLCGGHTIEDKEPKYGLCVTGFTEESRLLLNSSARPGDLLILTKPLGAGVLTTAAKAGLLDKKSAAYDMLIRSMTALNNAHDAMDGLRVHACTDITGFGLLGHSTEMARGSGVSIRLRTATLPLMEEALNFARMGIVPAGAYRNRTHFGDDILFSTEPAQELNDLLFDPQTSGGLLISVAADDAQTLLRRLKERSDWPALVGEVLPFAEKPLLVS